MDEEVPNENNQEVSKEEKEEKKTEESKPKPNDESEKVKEDVQETKEKGKKDKFEKVKKYKNNLTDKMRKNPWIASTFLLGIFMLIILITGFSGITGGTVSEGDVGDAFAEFAKSQIGDIEIINVEKESGLYKIYYFSRQGDGIVYVTLDGKNLVNGLIPLSIIDEESSQPANIPKSDIPIVELFVMTHCPYGTQAEKGLIPVIRNLGDTVDAKIRFVHYFMHEPEETETPRQVCIREEQSDKFLDYLECFLEDGDSDRCLTEAGIDKTKMNDCISSERDAEYYTKDSDLSKEYGVQGSPTLVINGVQVDSGRSSSAYLDTICGAFNDIPAECESVLSSATPSPMWGWEGSTSETTATC